MKKFFELGRRKSRTDAKNNIVKKKEKCGTKMKRICKTNKIYKISEINIDKINKINKIRVNIPGQQIK